MAVREENDARHYKTRMGTADSNQCWYLVMGVEVGVGGMAVLLKVYRYLSIYVPQCRATSTEFVSCTTVP